MFWDPLLLLVFNREIEERGCPIGRTKQASLPKCLTDYQTMKLLHLTNSNGPIA